MLCGVNLCQTICAVSLKTIDLIGFFLENSRFCKIYFMQHTPDYIYELIYILELIL